MQMVPLIGFAPDVEATTPGAVIACEQFIPSPRGMKAAEAFVATGYPALAAAAQGAAVLTRLDGTTRFFACTAAAIYEGSANAWTDRSRVGAYSAGDARWSLAQFGNDSLAANKTCVLQRSTATVFSDLVAPKCGLIEVIGGQVLAANVDDTGAGLGTTYGDRPNAWWCSALNDCTSWATSIATQAATGLIVEAPGPIKALKRLGGVAIAYKADSMFIGRYVGAQQGVWAWEQIPGEIGCSSNEAVISIGTAHLFVGPDDFYLYDGSRPVPIGAPLRKWFFARLNRKFQHKIAGLHDASNGLIWWFYPSSASQLGALDSAVVYDYRTQRWGTADRAIDMPVQIVQDGATYGTLGTLFATYADLPTIAYGSPFWQSGKPVPGVINSDHRPCTLSGVPGAWSFTTGLLGDDQSVSLITRVNPRWVKRPTAATMTPSWTMDEGHMVADGLPVVMSDNSGRFDMLRAARWHQFRFNCTGEGETPGITISAKPAGME